MGEWHDVLCVTFMHTLYIALNQFALENCNFNCMDEFPIATKLFFCTQQQPTRLYHSVLFVSYDGYCFNPILISLLL